MKRKGLVLQFELVIVFLMIALLIGGSLVYNNIAINRERMARLQEMSAIEIALEKYAKHHVGAVPRVEDNNDPNEWVLATIKKGDDEVNRFLYDKPGLYPKDLFELCELGYLPKNFFGEMDDYQTISDSYPATSSYGVSGKGRFIYKAYENELDTDIKQYTKYELSYEGKNPKLNIPYRRFVSE